MSRGDIAEIYNVVAIAILLPFTILYVIYRTDPRYLIALGLILLIAAAVESSAGNSSISNDIAIVFFYCLLAGVMLLIIDDHRETRRHSSRVLVSPVETYAYALIDRLKKHYTFIIGTLVPALFFSLISLFIMSAFLAPGYVLVTDMVFGPRVSISGVYALSPALGGGNALALFEYVAYAVIPAWLVEKIFLFLIFFLSSSTMYLFSGHFRLNGPSRYFSSILYAVNPFVYARMLAGAWGLLFAYSLSPLAFLLFVSLMAAPTRKDKMQGAARAALVFSLLAVFDIHTFVLMVGISALYFIVLCLYEGRGNLAAHLYRTGTSVLLIAAMLCLLNFYWLTSAGSSTRQIMGTFTFLDAIAFASTPTVFGNTMLSVAAMYGFFRTGYIYPLTLFPSLISIFFLFLFLSIFGLISYYGTARTPAAVSLAVAAVFSILFATGISSPLTAGLYTFMFDNFPLFNGFREPQKFVAIVVMAYSFLGGLGLLQLQSYLTGVGKNEGKRSGIFRGNSRKYVVAAVAVIIAVSLVSPFVYSYMEMNSFNGQLTNVQYPSSWYRAESIMNNNTSDYSTLILPWHGYMYYNWSRTKFASPFNSFFKQNLIYGGRNTYVGGEGSQQLFSPLILSILGERNNISHLGNILSVMDVKYVFLSKSADYWNYSFLYHQSDMRLVENTTACALFLNLHPVSRAYIVHKVLSVQSYSELITLSARVNLTDYAWLVPGGATPAVGGGYFLPLVSNKVDDARYNVLMPGIIGLNSSSYLVFVTPGGVPSEWSSEPGLVSYFSQSGIPVSHSIGDMIFLVSGGPGSITFDYVPFQSAWITYGVSAASFAVIVTLFVALPVLEERFDLRRLLPFSWRRNS